MPVDDGTSPQIEPVEVQTRQSLPPCAREIVLNLQKLSLLPSMESGDLGRLLEHHSSPLPGDEPLSTRDDRNAAHLNRPAKKLIDTDSFMMDVWVASSRCLLSKVSDNLFRGAALVDFLLQIGKRLDEEQRSDVCEVEGIE